MLVIAYFNSQNNAPKKAINTQKSNHLINFRVNEENLKWPKTLKMKLGEHLIGMNVASAKDILFLAHETAQKLKGRLIAYFFYQSPLKQ